MSADDVRWLGAALALAERGVGCTAPNPSVGCILVKAGHVVGRGWTQPGGRPHAEEMALAEAGASAEGATAYVTLEPCAHQGRGPKPCCRALIESKVARVVVACLDPDPRTAGEGIAALRAAGVETSVGLREAEAKRLNAGFMLRKAEGRPHVTLKLALSIDGRIALPSGESRWITGASARAHAHLERARVDLIVVGRGTLETDDPVLDVRLAGLGGRSPRPAVLSASLPEIPATARLAGRDAVILRRPSDIDSLPEVNAVLVEGGAGTAAAFLAADRVDRLLVYHAPILIGEGRPAVADLGLAALADAHGRWAWSESRRLGEDRLEIYDRLR